MCQQNLPTFLTAISLFIFYIYSSLFFMMNTSLLAYPDIRQMKPDTGYKKGKISGATLKLPPPQKSTFVYESDRTN